MKCTFFVIFLITVSIPARGQWKNIFENQGVIYALCVHDSSLFLSTGGGLGGVFRYYGGTDWIPADTGLPQGTTSFASLGNYFFAGISNGLIYQSTNNGYRWNGNDSIGSPIATNGTDLFAVDAKGLSRSMDSGKKWVSSGNNLTPSNFSTAGAWIFASTSSGIYRSTDSGSHWAKDTTPSGLSISAFAVIGSQLFGGGSGVFQSSDSGGHWTPIGLPTRTVNALASYKTYLFAGTDTGVFISFDSGVHWKNASDSLLARGTYHPNVTTLAILDTILYAGVDVGDGFCGISERPISEMIDTAPSSVQSIIEQPGMTLSVYPNPLSNSATIDYTLAEASRVSITIYDALGKTVYVPIQNIDEQSGNHEITFDAQNLSSGTYWCRLSAGSAVLTSKLVIEH